MSLTLLFSSLIKKHKGLVVMVLFFSTVVILSAFGLFTTSSYLIAYCGLTPSIAEIMIPVVGVRFFGLSRGGFRYVERLISHESTFRILSDLRNKLYGQISKASISEVLLLDKEDAFTRLVDDIQRLQEFYLRTFNPYITALIIGIFGSVFMYRFEPMIAMVFIIFYGLSIVLMPLMVNAGTKGLYRKLVTKTGESKLIHLELLAGLSDIITNSALKPWMYKIETQWEDTYAIERKLAFWKSLSTALINFFMMSAIIISFSLAGYYMTQKAFNPVFVPVVAYGVFALFEGAQPVATILQKIEESKISAQRIEEVTSNFSQVSQEKFQKSQEGIRLEGLEFKYPKAKESILKNIDLELKKNKKIAVVGRSGQGKTTLSYLLLGWLNPSKGQIFYNDSPSKLFSVVNQEVYFFNTTILNNLKMGNSKATKEEIMEVLEKVQLVDFVKGLAKGLDYELGDGDIKLSGGQKQRLAIARALLKNTPYLIFDEISQGLDVKTEHELMKLLLYKIEDRGLFVLTHRLIQMEAYDEILVLDQGLIAERGSHKELMELKGQYAKMYKLQQSYVEFEP